MSYLDTTHDVYKEAALTPDVGLCCTTNPIWELPGLKIPKIMQEMNYGCGSTVNSRDLSNSPKILYVGVGGGMELLQFAYFSRQKNGVIGVDIVDEMLEASRKNFKIAEQQNTWFKSEFVDLVKGDALQLNVADNSIDVAAQNCLFNIFKAEDLKKAISEMYRVLKPHGRLVMSDPTCEQPMNDTLRNDARLRALCLSGSLPIAEYVKIAPLGSLLMVMLAHIGGTFIAGVSTTLLSKEIVVAYIVGGFFTISGIWNLYLLPHPMWFNIEVVLYLPAAVFGFKLFAKKS